MESPDWAQTAALLMELGNTAFTPEHVVRQKGLFSSGFPYSSSILSTFLPVKITLIYIRLKLTLPSFIPSWLTFFFLAFLHRKTNPIPISPCLHSGSSHCFVPKC